MAEKLTPQQQMAVENRGGKLLVSAAAGSGKTKVLVDRLLKYINDPVEPANIDEFLIITYTKAAAAELRSKIAVKLSEHIARDPENRHLQRQLQRLYLTKISTVHSFCSDILREYAYLLDIAADFRVADENEVEQLRLRAMDQVLEEAYGGIENDPDFQAFVDTQGLGRNDALIPEIILGVYGSAMCHIDPESWCSSCIDNMNLAGITDPSETLWGRFLMDDLFTTLDEQIRSLETCASLIQQEDGMEKPVALLMDTVYQLRNLRQSDTWEKINERKNIAFGTLSFPKKYKDAPITAQVKAVRNHCKDVIAKKTKVFSDSASQALGDLLQSEAAARGLMAAVSRFTNVFGLMKRQRRLLDFSDLEHYALDLLLGKNRTGPTAAAREIAARFREIMVDEYQDSNGVQDAIFSALTMKRQNLFLVGDVKQSIYQFRLADPGIFLEKYESYVPAETAVSGQGRKVMLSSNFRSGGGVIEGANHVFATCMSPAVGGLYYGEAEALREGIPHCALNEPEVELYAIRVQEDTYAEEASFVADRICQLLDGNHFVRDGESLRAIQAEDIVILLRSPGSTAMAFIEALDRRGIRCASGAGTDLLLQPEIETMRALLQIISNPRQDIPLLAALTSPVFCFDADTLGQLRAAHRKGGLYDALLESSDPEVLAFREILSDLRKTAAMTTLPELFGRIFWITQLDSVYAAMEGGRTARENLQEFYQLAADFSGNGGDLDRFLKHLDALDVRGLPSGSDESVSGCVTIMSIHKSKGLEFPVVFLAGLSRGFNTQDLRAQVLCHKEMGLGLSCLDAEKRVRYPTISKSAISVLKARDMISEEMRVLYVAMTRPKDRLIMTYASSSLDNEIADISLRMDISPKEAMTRDVNCPGKWVLYSALKRTEAGELFALGTKPRETTMSSCPWLIRVLDGSVAEAVSGTAVEAEKTVEEKDIRFLERALVFQYDHIGATLAPSKQTATQRKGRQKDQEAAENAKEPEPQQRHWRKPSFSSAELDPTAYGTAMHRVLQYIRFSSCTDEDSIRKEINRLTLEGFLKQEHADRIDAVGLTRFFATELGWKLIHSENVLREFKFSILDDAREYGEDLEEEQVLLQGVVDCAIVEPDGITIIDFKTDHVTADTVDTVAERYSPQINTYAAAMTRIYRKPVKGKALYFFRMGKTYWL